MNNKVKYNTYSRNVYSPNNQITGMINRPINNLNANSGNYKNNNIILYDTDIHTTNNLKSFNKGINNYRNNCTSTQNESPFLLTGGEASGSVWINPSYNVAKESPGISWVL